MFYIIFPLLHAVHQFSPFMSAVHQVPSGQDFQDLGQNLTELTESEISKYNGTNIVLIVLETINDVYFA